MEWEVDQGTTLYQQTLNYRPLPHGKVLEPFLMHLLDQEHLILLFVIEI